MYVWAENDVFLGGIICAANVKSVQNAIEIKKYDAMWNSLCHHGRHQQEYVWLYLDVSA